MVHIHEFAPAFNKNRQEICHDVVDWAQVALDAWSAPSWREAAIEYHKDALSSPQGHRPLAPRSSADGLIPSRREIWRSAGRCIKRRRSRDALRTFLKWCNYTGVEHSIGLPIFTTIVQKELSK